MQVETEFLSLAEHAQRLGVASKWVANKVAAGTWPARVVKLGRRRLVHVSEHQRMVRQLLESAGIKSPADAPNQPPTSAVAPGTTETGRMQGGGRKPGRPREASRKKS